MSDPCISSRCMAIARCHFLNTPYREKSAAGFSQMGRLSDKAAELCHYCTVDTLHAILNSNCLRFTDVRFLNDSTEFIEVLSLIERVIADKRYAPEFRELILNSQALQELKEYKQSYAGYSRREHGYKQTVYHTYTCSFSINKDSLSMWNYYGAAAAGLNVVFDLAWNIFRGSEETEVNIGKILNNDIVLYRAVVLYSREEKEKCVAELLNRLAQLFEDAENELDTHRGSILYAFKESINNMRCFFKNEAFRSEEEYRVVLKIPEDLLQGEEPVDEIKGKGVFRKGNVLIPYVDYEFRRESIQRVTVNPYDKDPDSMLKLGLRHFLWTKGLEDVEVVSSNIPIRKYD